MATLAHYFANEGSISTYYSTIRNICYNMNKIEFVRDVLSTHAIFSSFIFDITHHRGLELSYQRMHDYATSHGLSDKQVDKGIRTALGFFKESLNLESEKNGDSIYFKYALASQMFEMDSIKLVELLYLYDDILNQYLIYPLTGVSFRTGLDEVRHLFLLSNNTTTSERMLQESVDSFFENLRATPQVMLLKDSIEYAITPQIMNTFCELLLSGRFRSALRNRIVAINTFL